MCDNARRGSDGQCGAPYKRALLRQSVCPENESLSSLPAACRAMTEQNRLLLVKNETV